MNDRHIGLILDGDKVVAVRPTKPEAPPNTKSDQSPKKAVDQP